MNRLLFIFFCLVFNQTLSQPFSKEGFQTFNYSTENGLPSNGVKGMHWDEDGGFLWIATEAGISRFNGIDFVNYTRNNTSFIESERMRFSITNANGEMRVVDLDGNIIGIKENKPFLLYKRQLSLDQWENRLMGIAVSDSFFKNSKLSPVSIIPFPFAQIIPLNEGTSWVVQPNGAVLRIAAPTFAPIVQEQFGKDNKQGFISGGEFFLIKKGAGRIYRVDQNNNALIELPAPIPNTPINIFWESGMKSPIAIGNNRAWLLHLNNGLLKAEEICTSVPSMGLIKYAQYSESKRILFIGTSSRGLIVLRKNRLTQMRKAGYDMNDLNAYYSQLEFSPGNVLTNEGHFIRGADADINNTPPISGKFGFSLYREGDSLVWFLKGLQPSNQNVLHCLDLRTGITKAYKKIPINNVFSFARWKNEILIGNYKGLGKIAGDSLQMLYPSEQLHSSVAIQYNLTESDPGVFLLTSCSGYIKYDLNENRVDTLLSLPGYCIRTQHKIGDYFLVGTYGKGFYIYHKGRMKQMPLDKNEFLLYTHCFISDKNGFIWMSTNRGLFKASWEDLRRAFHENEADVYYHYYGRKDGMEMTELNGGCSPCGIELKNGVLSFPSMDGLVWIDPNNKEDVFPDGPIQIDEISVNGTVHGVVEKSKLPPNAEVLIRLGYSAWSNNENIYIDYRLNDGKWIRVSENRGYFIQLTNLSAGSNTLQIRKRNGFGRDNFSYRTFTFLVEPSWYEKWWVYLLFISFLVVIIDAVSRYRNRRLLARQILLQSLVNEKTQSLKQQNDLLEKNNSIKTRLISIISHDIVTPLKFLTVAGKGLIDNKEKLSDEVQRETLTDITQTAQELQLLSTNILNWIKYQNENRLLLPESFFPHQPTHQVFNLLGSLAKEKKIQLINSIDPSWKIEQFADPIRILIYNLVSNSIRYADSGVIEVGASTTSGDEYAIWVIDEGIGMKQETIDHLLKEDALVHNKTNESRSGHGLGYLIIKDLVRWIGGRIEIESETGKGTRVSVFIRPRKRSTSTPIG